MTLHETYADVHLQSGETARVFIPSTRVFTEKLEGLQRDLDIDVINHIPIKVHETSPFLQALLVLSGPLITIGIFLAFLSITRRAAGGGDSVILPLFFLFSPFHFVLYKKINLYSIHAQLFPFPRSPSLVCFGH